MLPCGPPQAAADLDVPTLDFADGEMNFENVSVLWDLWCRSESEASERPSLVASRLCDKRLFTIAQRDILNGWLAQAATRHQLYASKADVERLATETGLTRRQVRVFLVNWRCRHKALVRSASANLLQHHFDWVARRAPK
jgi:hypothetical protein